MPPDTSKLLRDIDAACREFADPALVKKYARYFVEGWDAYGVHIDDPAWQQRRAAWLDKHRGLGLNGFVTFGSDLFATGKYEHGALAVWFVSQFRDDLGPRAVAGIGKWFDGGVRNWAHNDIICGELLAPRLRDGAIAIDTLSAWRSSPHKFKRRAVPVAMLGLLKTATDVGPLLEFLRPLMMDGERVVQQGLGWFLREAWKKEPARVEAFLLEWKDTAPRLIFQYATEKMSKADRERFRRVKTGQVGPTPGETKPTEAAPRVRLTRDRTSARATTGARGRGGHR